MIFNPAPLIIASMNFRRRAREQEQKKEQEQLIENKKQWKQPQLKPLKGTQVEIYPVYAMKMVKEYKIEPDGQINIFEEVYRPQEIIKEYKINDGKIEKVL